MTPGIDRARAIDRSRKVDVSLYHLRGFLLLAAAVGRERRHRTRPAADMTAQPPAGIRVRRAQSFDLNEVVELYVGCGLVGSARGFRNELTRKLIRDPEFFLLAIEPDGTIAAALAAGFDGRLVTVSRLATHPDRRRLGLARLLVDHMEERLARLGASEADVIVVDDTPEARRFWQGVGYERVGGAVVYRAPRR